MQVKNSRWIMTFLAFLGLIICILDRSVLAYAIKPMEASFHLSNTQFGILSSAFSVGYLIMVFLGGFLVDRIGSRSVWAVTAINLVMALALIIMANPFSSVIGAPLCTYF